MQVLKINKLLEKDHNIHAQCYSDQIDVLGLNNLKLPSDGSGKTLDTILKAESCVMTSAAHLTQSEPDYALVSDAFKKKKILPSEVTFKAGKNDPFQRWYPYIEGYSPSFVKYLIEINNIRDTLIYEPFAGTGTTVFAADAMGFNTVYSEINPLLRLLISTKIEVQSLSKDKRKNLAADLLRTYEIIKASLGPKDIVLMDAYKNVFGTSKYFNDEVLTAILQLSYRIKEQEQALIRALLNIAVCSILVPVSYLKKQGDLRFKTSKEKLTETKQIFAVLPKKISEMCEDILNFDYILSASHECVSQNAKSIGSVSIDNIGTVITSPPYLNGTNYIRNTKLELWFLGYLKTVSDLRVLRDEILTSGINDVKSTYSNAYSICELSPLLNGVVSELKEKAYDKRIPLMAVSYFNEMMQVFTGLASKLKNNACILIDLGDSIFADVHIPTDKILIELFGKIGYALESNQVLRTRRSRNGSILSQFLITFKYTKL